MVMVTIQKRERALTMVMVTIQKRERALTMVTIQKREHALTMVTIQKRGYVLTMQTRIRVVRNSFHSDASCCQYHWPSSNLHHFRVLAQAHLPLLGQRTLLVLLA